MKFPVSMDMNFTIPPVPVAGTPLSLENISIDLNIDSLLKANNPNLSLKNIRSVTLNKVNISIPEESRHVEDNLSSIDFLIVYFSSTGKAESLKLFEVQQPQEKYELEVEGNNSVDLKEYFQSNSFNFDFEGAMGKSTEHELPLNIRLKFIIEAGL